MMRFLLGLICVFAFAALLGCPLTAQTEAAEQSFGTTLIYGARVIGELNDATPSRVYQFEGLRGDVITIDLTASSGSLDPILTLVDADGQVIALRDDSGDARSIRIDSLRLPATNLYYLIAARFGYGLGTTSGRYTLQIERVGASAESGSVLRYGDSVINRITDSTPQLYYSFRANAGDVIAIQMQRVSGDLDPYLMLVNSRAFVIAENDDVPGSGSLDAAIQGYLIEEDGVYVIIATRFGQAAGRSSGSFVLTLQRASDGGLGRSALAARPIAIGATVTGEINDEQVNQFYRFEGRRGETITITMVRNPGGDLDSYLILANASVQELASNDDSFGTQNSTIEAFTLPYDGIYYVIATRYQREAGRTRGPYTLRIERVAPAPAADAALSANIPAISAQLNYGDAIAGHLDDTTPQLLYVFRGAAGDAITVTMNRTDGDLDPRVAILDEELRELASDDDSGGAQNARIDRFILPEDGLYFLQAGRYIDPLGGLPTSGGFVLVLTQRFD
ncbi:MAG: PPC domain-containing protein [Aggregatilineales bacterium]